MTTLYIPNDSWDLKVRYENGSIYMEEFGDEKDKKEEEMDDRGKLMCYWGYKFEGLSTIDIAPHDHILLENDVEDTREDNVVNLNIQYCSVFRSKFDRNTIIMGGEVDCIDSGCLTNYII